MISHLQGKGETRSDALKIINSNLFLNLRIHPGLPSWSFVSTPRFLLIVGQFPRKPWLCWKFVQREGNSRLGAHREVMPSKGPVCIVCVLELPFFMFLFCFLNNLLFNKLLFFNFYNAALVSAIQQFRPAILIHPSLVSWFSHPSPPPTPLGHLRGPDWAPCVTRDFSPALHFAHNSFSTPLPASLTVSRIPFSASASPFLLCK